MQIGNGVPNLHKNAIFDQIMKQVKITNYKSQELL